MVRSLRALGQLSLSLCRCVSQGPSAMRSIPEQYPDQKKLKLEAELTVEDGAWCGHRGRHEGALHGQAAR